MPVDDRSVDDWSDSTDFPETVSNGCSVFVPLLTQWTKLAKFEVDSKIIMLQAWSLCALVGYCLERPDSGAAVFDCSLVPDSTCRARYCIDADLLLADSLGRFVRSTALVLPWMFHRNIIRRRRACSVAVPCKRLARIGLSFDWWAAWS